MQALMAESHPELLLFDYEGIVFYFSILHPRKIRFFEWFFMLFNF